MAATSSEKSPAVKQKLDVKNELRGWHQRNNSDKGMAVLVEERIRGLANELKRPSRGRPEENRRKERPGNVRRAQSSGDSRVKSQFHAGNCLQRADKKPRGFIGGHWRPSGNSDKQKELATRPLRQQEVRAKERCRFADVPSATEHSVRASGSLCV